MVDGRVGEKENDMSEIEDVEEYSYYEEEILSYCGLSTIIEGENESACSSTQASKSASHHQSTVAEPTIPNQIHLSPRHEIIGDFSPKVLALVSPMLFSPMAEARRLKIKSPMIGSRVMGLGSPSPRTASKKTPSIPSMPLVLTNVETGEEVVMDDDEFTLVSCDDSFSAGLGSSSNLEYHASLDTLPKYPLAGSSSSLDNISFDTLPRASLSGSSASLDNVSLDLLPNHSFDSADGKESSVPASAKPAATSNGPRTIPHYKIDFDATKKLLEGSLERRMKRGKLRAERMDYMRRKLRYELQRKMLQAEMNQCLIPSKRRTDAKE